MNFLNFQMLGLMKDTNQQAAIPPGAMVRALNTVITKPGIVEPRRGSQKYGSAVSLGVEYFNSIMKFRNRLIINYGSNVAYDSDESGTWSAYSGSYTPPAVNTKMRGVEANQNFYFNTYGGVYKLSDITGTPAPSGVPRAIGGSGSLSDPVAPAVGFLQTDSAVAYRIVWTITDSNSNLVIGSPSQRLVIRNSSGDTKNVSLQFYIPQLITTNYQYQIYRSQASLSATDEPTDDLQLIAQASPSVTDISNGYFTYLDSINDSLSGATLYTSPSLEGINNQNDPPPYCLDMCQFKTLTLYANTYTRHQMFASIKKINSTDGLQIGDTISVGDSTYTASLAEDFTANKFKLFTSGSDYENIESTSYSLVNCINTASTNRTIYAFYLSGYSDSPGSILIEGRTLSVPQFYIKSTRGAAWTPEIPASYSTSYASDNNVSQNKVYVSKSQQPEAVPVLNYLAFGSPNFPIRRILSSRDSVYVFKDDGIYRVTGDDISNMSQSIIDLQCIIQAPESATILNNNIFFYSNQGACFLNENGWTNISNKYVETDLRQLYNIPNFGTTSFGVSYETERSWIFFVPANQSDNYPSGAYVYNYFTKAWTTFELSRSCGLVVNNKMYLGRSDSTSYIYQERKSYNNSDYIDDILDVTITGSYQKSVFLASTSGLYAGMILKQSNEIIITEVVSSTEITMDSDATWTPGAATVQVPIITDIEFVPQPVGDPGTNKHFQEATIICPNSAFPTLQVGFYTNFNGTPAYTSITNQSGIGWGQEAWGVTPWGGDNSGNQSVRLYIPLEMSRGLWLNCRIKNSVSKSKYQISGISIGYEEGSTRFR